MIDRNYHLEFERDTEDLLYVRKYPERHFPVPGQACFAGDQSETGWLIREPGGWEFKTDSSQQWGKEDLIRIADKIEELNSEEDGDE